jgi:hypothetical protein
MEICRTITRDRLHTIQLFLLINTHCLITLWLVCLVRLFHRNFFDQSHSTSFVLSIFFAHHCTLSNHSWSSYYLALLSHDIIYSLISLSIYDTSLGEIRNRWLLQREIRLLYITDLMLRHPLLFLPLHCPHVVAIRPQWYPQLHNLHLHHIKHDLFLKYHWKLCIRDLRWMRVRKRSNDSSPCCFGCWGSSHRSDEFEAYVNQVPIFLRAKAFNMNCALW